jgi:hypothetical protein
MCSWLHVWAVLQPAHVPRLAVLPAPDDVPRGAPAVWVHATAGLIKEHHCSGSEGSTRQQQVGRRPRTSQAAAMQAFLLSRPAKCAA